MTLTPRQVVAYLEFCDELDRPEREIAEKALKEISDGRQV